MLLGYFCMPSEIFLDMDHAPMVSVTEVRPYRSIASFENLVKSIIISMAGK